jgi:hypothetical protein
LLLNVHPRVQWNILVWGWVFNFDSRKIFLQRYNTGCIVWKIAINPHTIHPIQDSLRCRSDWTFCWLQNAYCSTSMKRSNQHKAPRMRIR